MKPVITGIDVKSLVQGVPVSGFGFHHQFPEECMKYDGFYPELLELQSLKNKPLFLGVNNYDWSTPWLNSELLYRVDFDMKNPMVLKNLVCWEMNQSNIIKKALREGHDSLVIVSPRTVTNLINSHEIVLLDKSCVKNIRLLNTFTFQPLFNCDKSTFTSIENMLLYYTSNTNNTKPLLELLKITPLHYIYIELFTGTFSPFNALLKVCGISSHGQLYKNILQSSFRTLHEHSFDIFEGRLVIHDDVNEVDEDDTEDVIMLSKIEEANLKEIKDFLMTHYGS